MTTSETETELIAQEVIDHDRDLQDDVKDAKRSLTSAKHRSSEVIAELNQWRWEMTVCPLGPRYSQREYAEAVKQARTTIEKGVQAWQAQLDASDSDTPGPICSFGLEPHDAREVAQPTPPPLTDKQIESHDKARRRIDNKLIKAIVIERLAAHWNVVATTMEVNHRELVNDAVIRLNEEHKLSEMTETQVTEAADVLARQLRLEFQEREAQMRVIHKWMATNRGLDVQGVKMADVRKMHAHVLTVAKRKSLSYREAETECREWDFKHREAERIKHEIERAARMAVLELRSAANDMKRAALRLGEAMRKIDADSVPVTGDELAIIEMDLADSEAILKQARASIGGQSGVDWDAELRALDKEAS